MIKVAHVTLTIALLSVFLYGLLFAVTEYLPDAPASACNCAGKGHDCYEQDFEFPNGLDAHCAFYGVRANCCEYRER